MNRVYLGLGSNKGDKIGYIQQAVRMLCGDGNIALRRCSSFYETEPWGNNEQDWFVNAVIEVDTVFEPLELLEKCNLVEKHLGRSREEAVQWGPREIDIDILIYEDRVVEMEELQVPHRHMHKRAFVLVPFLELAPELVHPLSGKTIFELHAGLEELEDVYLYGTALR